MQAHNTDPVREIDVQVGGDKVVEFTVSEKALRGVALAIAGVTGWAMSMEIVGAYALSDVMMGSISAVHAAAFWYASHRHG